MNKRKILAKGEIKQKNKQSPPKMKSASPLGDKNIILVGVESAEAKYLAMNLAKEGGNLVFTDREKLIMNNLSKQVKAKHKIKPFCVPLDLRKDSDLHYHKLATILTGQKYKKLDAAIILPGYKGFMSSFLSYPTQMWKEVTQVNVVGVFILVKTLLPFLLSAEKPSLIFSLGEPSRVENNLAYAAALNAVRGIMQGLANEMLFSHLSVLGIDTSQNYSAKDSNEEANIAKLTETAKFITGIIAGDSKTYHSQILQPK